MFQAGLVGHRQITTLPRKIESRGTRRDFPLKSPWKWVFAWSPRAVVAFSPSREKEGGSGWGKKKIDRCEAIKPASACETSYFVNPRERTASRVEIRRGEWKKCNKWSVVTAVWRQKCDFSAIEAARVTFSLSVKRISSSAIWILSFTYKSRTFWNVFADVKRRSFCAIYTYIFI